MLAARRFGQQPKQQSQNKAGNGGGHERSPPTAKVMGHIAADKVSGGASYRQSQKEDGEHAAAARDRKRIGDQRGRDGGIAGLANSHNGVTEEQLVVVVHEPRQQRKTAPDKDADHNNDFAGKTVAQ